jgi:hypothetical protein
MSKIHRRTYTAKNDSSFATTIHQGFNYFSELELSKSALKIRSQQKGRVSSMAGVYSQGNLEGRQKSVSDMLRENKETCFRIKTEFSMMRDC